MAIQSSKCVLVSLIIGFCFGGAEGDVVTIDEFGVHPSDGEYMTLTCTVLSTSTGAAVQWKIPGHSSYISENCNKISDPSVQYINLTCDVSEETYSISMAADFERDFGDFLCVKGAGTSTKLVDIYHVVTEVDVRGDLEVTEGIPGILTCKTNDCGYPEPTIKWKRGDDDITTSEQSTLCDNSTNPRNFVNTTGNITVEWTDNIGGDQIIYSCCAIYDGRETVPICSNVSVYFAGKEDDPEPTGLADWEIALIVVSCVIVVGVVGGGIVYYFVIRAKKIGGDDETK